MLDKLLDLRAELSILLASSEICTTRREFFSWQQLLLIIVISAARILGYRLFLSHNTTSYCSLIKLSSVNGSRRKNEVQRTGSDFKQHFQQNFPSILIKLHSYWISSKWNNKLFLKPNVRWTPCTGNQTAQQCPHLESSCRRTIVS